MKQFYAGIAGIFFMTALPAFADEVQKSGNFENDRARNSYALGVQTGRTFSKDAVDIDIDQYIKGLKDQVGKQKLLLTDDELRSVLNNFQVELQRTMKKNRAMAGGENMRKGQEFMEQNKKKAGVVTLENGIQYRVITEGKGKKPVETDTIECNYKGSLVDGKQFDASAQGKPATMKLTQLIPGMKEVLKMMPVGSHWEVVIPGALAYGPRSVGQDIGPNSTLVFDLELVSIK